MHRRALVLTLLAVSVVLAHPVLARQEREGEPPLPTSAASSRVVIFEAFMRPG